MILIAKNPNTNIPSVGIRLTGYFGVEGDGIKLVDQDVVFPIDRVVEMGKLPDNVFDTNQKTPPKTEGKDKNFDENGHFAPGNEIGKKGGRPSKNPLTDRVRAVLENKHYETKGGKRVVAYDLLAEAIVDYAVLKGNPKIIESVWERLEGKVTQGIKLGGAIAHGVANDEEIKRLIALFPDTTTPPNNSHAE